MTKEERLAEMRRKMKDKSGGRAKDPDQFIPPKAKGDEKIEYYIRILPPIMAGERYKGGVADNDMEFFFYENGSHWINNERHECPRLHHYGQECPLCKAGFELMNDAEDKALRSEIAKRYLPRSYFAMNIYFINSEKNPEQLRNKVMWCNMPKTVFDIMEECFNNDDPGDAEEPKAHGMFFDPEEGYTFKLLIEKKNDYNTYERSMFLAGSVGPLVATEDGTPDLEAIDDIMSRRHNLRDRFSKCNIAKLNEIVSVLSGTNSGDAEEISTVVESKTPVTLPKVAPVAPVKTAVAPKPQTTTPARPVTPTPAKPVVATKPQTATKTVATPKPPAATPAPARPAVPAKPPIQKLQPKPAPKPQPPQPVLGEETEAAEGAVEENQEVQEEADQGVDELLKQINEE